VANDDKRFEATASRLARAKREGDVPRSHDLAAVASLGSAGVATLIVMWPLGAAARLALANAARAGYDSPLPFVAIALCVLAVMVAAIVASVAASYLQAGAFTLKFPAPKFEKLDPWKGLGRMFGCDAAVAAAKALVVSCAVSLAAFMPLRATFGASRGGGSPPELAALVVGALEGALSGALVVAFVCALADALFERIKWRRRLRMSFDELKRDHKQNEGDPLLRGRRRQQHRALVRGSVARVRDAAVVVANPTHVAIALEYRPPEVAVPRVLVRAIDEGAQEVKRLARELRVPIVENVALARELLASTDVGDFIPPSAYAAVAAIVAVILREKARAS
jgi:flagellar biosynthesis protein FlhB